MIDLIASNPFLRVAILGGLFLVVVSLCLVAIRVQSQRSGVRRELRSIAIGSGGQVSAPTLLGRQNDALTRMIDRIERAGLNLADTKSDVLRERMVAAGFESPAAPRLFTLIRLILVILLPTALVMITLMAGSSLSFTKLYLFGSIAAVAGLYLPALVVRAKADRRREAIINGFPDSLDLMLVCVEAGLGLEAAIDRVGREMVNSQPLVARMLTTATMQLRAGASRETALRRMAQATGVEEIRSFAALLIQSDKLGSSIAATLRVYAAEMREKRRMRAEEKAHRIPVLISIPLVTCMLPVMIGVLMLPASVQIARQLLPAMQGSR
ncbi:type II secretion system F family protein (plasmid) [Sphingobium sp. V4]|uniref:type II secretion system F family protein n=1 Tax=Sphingobium sp. V4 TaxID=3038927 RepID=UPI002558265E|nr:type II secretion system F family protein [Sphingobium sp. V4]WIW90615.1 type II secretion system F family protein [Sphingobium sp. V4]